MSSTHHMPHHVPVGRLIPSPPPLSYPFGSYKHSLVPLHTSSTIALPGNRFCHRQLQVSLSLFPTHQNPIPPFPLPFHSAPVPPLPMLSIRKKTRKSQTHRKHDHNLPFPFYHHGEVIPHLEAPKCLMDEDVADLRGGDEAGGGGEEVRGREGAGLDAEGAEDQEAFFCLLFCWLVCGVFFSG